MAHMTDKKFAILGDTHFGARSDSLTHMSYMAKFYDEVFFPRLEKDGIKKIFQLGDFLDRRKFVNFNTLNQTKEIFLDRAEAAGCEVYILVGNHDIYWRDTIKLNSISQLYKSYSNVHCVDEPMTVTVGKDLEIDIIPWICKENEADIMSFIEHTSSSILMGHLELSGFPMYKGITSEHGMGSGPFAKYDQVFTGHYHTHSVKDNIEYLGTPYEITWSDCNDSKGFGIYDVKLRAMEFVYNPFRIFHKIVYNDSQHNYKKFDFAAVKNSYIKIFIEHRKSEEDFDKFLETLYNKSEPLDVTITDLTSSYTDSELDSIQSQDPLSVLIQSVSDDVKDAKDIRMLIQEIHAQVLQDGASE
jgi:DNA repair exonuclease SbcCD nuclease subunit